MSTFAETTAAETPLPPPRFDFPTWMPPMFVKELRQGLRTRGFIGSMVGFQAIMVIAFVWAFASNIFGESRALQTVNGFFWSILGVMLLVITPLRAMAGLRQEIDAKTLDLLMLTHLTSWRVVLGKWTSLLAQAALLVMALLPFGVVRYYFGAVDLLEDFMGIAMMFMGCAGLTALALWLSGLPRILRIGVPIVCFFLLQGIGSNSFRFGRVFHGFNPSGDDWWVVCLFVFNFSLLLLFFLVQAVRRIAPPAENHSPLARGVALLTLLPVVPLYLLEGGMPNATIAQMWFAVVALGLVSVIEISSLRVPMAVQVRTWWERGRFMSVLGRLVLQGWPSAMLFTVFWLALAAIAAQMGLIQLPGAGRIEMVWLFVLLWAALVFPMVLLSFAPRVGRQAPLFYFIIQALFGILCIMEGNSSTTTAINPLVEKLRWFFHVLPVASFWLEAADLGSRPGNNGRYLVGQAVMVGLLTPLVVWRMGFYWQWVRTQVLFVKRRKAAASE